MKAVRVAGFLLLPMALAVPTQSAGRTSPPELDRDRALEVSRAAIGQVVGDHRLLERRGEVFRFRELRGKPVVVSLIYTSCHHSCSIITQHLSRVVDVARDALGDDAFSVVSIGFDATVDTPERMRAYARQQGITARQWRFLSTDPTTIAALSAELGFVYRRSPRGFDHLAQTTVLDSNGQVYRQVYGEDFDAPALVEPLKELALGERSSLPPLSGLMDRIRIFCTLYDPASGRYRFDYSIVVAIAAGVVSLGAIAVFLIHAWRQTSQSGSKLTRR